MSGDSITVRCFAKINLSLRILGRREDGFHELRTVLQSIDLHDILGIRLAGDGLRLTCDDIGLPTDERNLVRRAAAALFNRCGYSGGAVIELRKRIPIAAGLGGGSSDAAATLRALNALLGRPLRREELLETAAELGSDVPYFLVGGCVRASGRGERLTPLPSEPRIDLLVLFPDISISAAQAYAHFDLTYQPPMGDSTWSSPAGEGRKPGSLGINDLERGVFAAFPQVRRLKERLLEEGAREAIMCGSGSAVAGSFAGPREAARAAVGLGGSGIKAFISRSVARGSFNRGFRVAGSGVECCPDSP